MKLLVLTTSYPSDPDDYRGRFAHDVSAALARCGHGVTVLTPHPGRKALECEAMDGVAVCRLSSPAAVWGGQPTLFGRHGVLETLRQEPWRVAELAPAMALLTARAASKAADCDLVISHWTIPCGLLGGEVARRQGLPHILIEHGGGIRLLRSLPGGRKAATRIMDRTTLLHCVSGKTAEAMLELLPPGSRGEAAVRTTVQPMPAVDEVLTRPVARLYRRPRRALFIGRFVPGKGVTHLLQALAGTRDMHLTMVGDGPGLRRAVQCAGAAGIEGRVHFLGEVGSSALPVVLAGHDVLVVPSAPHGKGRADLLEGGPRVLLQGMAAGLVPVVSAVGGMPEVVQHEINGLVVPPGDPAALGAALCRLEQGAGMCGSFARQARGLAAQLSMETLLAQWDRHIPGLKGGSSCGSKGGNVLP